MTQTNSAGQCNAIQRCWAWYYGYWTADVRERDIALADSLIRFRMASLPSRPGIAELQSVRTAIDLAISLRSRQWREMVRAPFDFPYKSPEPPPSVPKGKPRPTIDNLLELLS